MITVIMGKDNHMFALNNRRLYVLKKLREAGFLAQANPPHHVLMRIKPATPKELLKYVPANFSLTATIMGVERGDATMQEDVEDVEEENEDEMEAYFSVLSKLKGKAKTEVHKAVKLSQKGKRVPAEDIIKNATREGLLNDKQASILIDYLCAK